MFLLLILKCVKKELFHFIYAIVASKKLFQIIRLYLEKKNSGILGLNIICMFTITVSNNKFALLKSYFFTKQNLGKAALDHIENFNILMLVKPSKPRKFPVNQPSPGWADTPFLS